MLHSSNSTSTSSNIISFQTNNKSPISQFSSKIANNFSAINSTSKILRQNSNLAIFNNIPHEDLPTTTNNNNREINLLTNSFDVAKINNEISTNGIMPNGIFLAESFQFKPNLEGIVGENNYNCQSFTSINFSHAPETIMPNNNNEFGEDTKLLPDYVTFVDYYNPSSNTSNRLNNLAPNLFVENPIQIMPPTITKTPNMQTTENHYNNNETNYNYEKLVKSNRFIETTTTNSLIINGNIEIFPHDNYNLGLLKDILKKIFVVYYY